MHLIMPSTKQTKEEYTEIYEILKWSTDSVGKAND